MTNPKPKSRTSKSTADPAQPEKYARLREELKAPYRGPRKVIYFVFGMSGLIGAVVFLAQLLAGREVESALPNFALQIGIIGLMVLLFRLEKK